MSAEQAYYLLTRVKDENLRVLLRSLLDRLAELNDQVEALESRVEELEG